MELANFLSHVFSQCGVCSYFLWIRLWTYGLSIFYLVLGCFYLIIFVLLYSLGFPLHVGEEWILPLQSITFVIPFPLGIVVSLCWVLGNLFGYIFIFVYICICVYICIFACVIYLSTCVIYMSIYVYNRFVIYV